MRSNRLITWRVLSFACVLLAPLSSRGESIFDNDLTPAMINANGFASMSFTNSMEGHQYQVADDFILPGDGSWSVDGARWTGVVANRWNLERIIGDTFDFDILILPDDNGRPSGTPQDTLPGTALAARHVQVTGMDNGVFKNAAEFRTSFDPIVLQGNTPYWIVIAAEGDFQFQESNESELGWAWLGEGGTGNAWQGGADFQNDWLQQRRHQDFGLFGESLVTTLPGDYNSDGELDVLDVDLQSAEMGKSPAEQDLELFDHNGDAVVDLDDRLFWIENFGATWMGDANFDGEFSSLDFVTVFVAGKYEQDTVASWAEGDWNGDLRFSTSDLVAAFEVGGYEQGPRSAMVAAVPEPAAGLMGWLSIVPILWGLRRSQRVFN